MAQDTGRRVAISLACASLAVMAACHGVNGNGDEDTAGVADAAGVAAARHADSVADAVRRRVATSAGSYVGDSATKQPRRPDSASRR